MGSRVRKVANADIPRFSGCLILGTLVGYLANQKGLKLASKQALWPYIDSFFAYQPSKKKEPEYVTAAYLRNRAGDLSSWYMWPMLLQHCYKQAGEPVVVTQDKALREVLFRLLPPCVTPSRAVAFSPSLDELTVDDKRALISLMTTICDVPIRGAADPSQQRERMKRLLILAKSYCTRAEEKQELDEVWDQWYLPGAGLEMHL